MMIMMGEYESMYECLQPQFFCVSLFCLFWIFFKISDHFKLQFFLCKINFFLNMSHYGPRICTVYLDIFCMYVNKCCFDAMFFSLESLPTRLSLSWEIDTIVCVSTALSSRHRGGSSFSLIAGLSNYKRGHHLVDWYK